MSGAYLSCFLVARKPPKGGRGSSYMHRGGGAALTPPTNNARWRSSSTCICGAYSYLTYMYKYCANEALSSFGFVPLAQAQTSQEGRPSAHAALWAGFGLIKWAWSKIFAALTRGYTVQKPLSIDPAYAPECSVTVILG
jgi:hypothetical protein